MNPDQRSISGAVCFVAAGLVNTSSTRDVVSRCGKPATSFCDRRSLTKAKVAQAPRQAHIVKCSSVQSSVIKTQAEFDQALKEKTLRIAFIGMSNCGKSFRSFQLRDEYGFDMVSVDEEIEKRIEPELTALGYQGIQGMAEWMGFPFDERNRKNEQRYLDIEDDVTANVKFPLSPAKANCTLDTTGSVIYLSQSTLEKLKHSYLIVHLEASDDILDIMTENYFTMPKPVVWGTAFNQKEGENGMDALRRCYPGLLRLRREKYNQLAHVVIPASISRGYGVNIKQFVDILRKKLPK